MTTFHGDKPRNFRVFSLATMHNGIKEGVAIVNHVKIALKKIGEGGR